ncbi:MAG: serpin family protein [Bacilli bacterium]|nr:serpin family protein [Bacilli bacterium]
MENNESKNETLETKENTNVENEVVVKEKTGDAEKTSVENNKSAATKPTKEEKSKKKNKNLIVIIIIIVLLALLGAYFVLTKGNKDNKKDVISNEPKKVSAYRMSGNSIEDFDLAFLMLESGEKNKLYSPLSIKYALAMLSEGAKGSTKEQIDDIIGGYKSNKYVNSNNMSFANAIFINNTYKNQVKESYAKNLNNKYNAEVIYDDFTSANTINSWVSNKTFNLVNNILDDKTVKDKYFFLINALAIDMEWNKKIQATTNDYRERYNVQYNHEKYSTSIPLIESTYGKVNFNGQDVDSVEFGASINNYDIVSTLGRDNIKKTITDAYTDWLKDPESYEYAKMSNELDVDKYVEEFIKQLDSNYKRVDTSTDYYFYIDDNVKAFAKDLKTYNGTTLEYVGIMPTNESLTDYIKNNNAKKINNIISNLKTIELNNFEKGKVTQITGKIPLFKYEYELQLVDDLKALGITNIFDKDKSDLSEIATGAYIDSAIHKANIEFSNDGIKAAAATIVGGYGSAAGGEFDYLFEVPVVTIDLTFDKPYMYIIRDKDTGEVWFTGTVYNPANA